MIGELNMLGDDIAIFWWHIKLLVIIIMGKNAFCHFVKHNIVLLGMISINSKKPKIIPENWMTFLIKHILLK